MAARREVLKNNATTTLDGEHNDAVTTLAVVDGSVFPATGDFRLLVGSELMLCTARSGNNLTVARGQEGTTAASHASSASVWLVLTQAAVQRYLRDNLPGADGGRAPLRLVTASGTPLSASDFTKLDGSIASSLADVAGGIVATKAGKTGGYDNSIYYRTAPTAPYKVSVCLSAYTFNITGGTFHVGFRESASGKLVTFGVRLLNPAVFSTKWSALNTPVGDYIGFDTTHFQFIMPQWLQLEDDGSHFIFSMSMDGMNWITLLSKLYSDAFTTAPDQVLWGVNPQNAVASTDCMYATLHAWDEGAS